MDLEHSCYPCNSFCGPIPGEVKEKANVMKKPTSHADCPIVGILGLTTQVGVTCSSILLTELSRNVTMPLESAKNRPIRSDAQFRYNCDSLGLRDIRP